MTPGKVLGEYLPSVIRKKQLRRSINLCPICIQYTLKSELNQDFTDDIIIGHGGDPE